MILLIIEIFERSDKQKHSGWMKSKLYPLNFFALADSLMTFTEMNLSERIYFCSTKGLLKFDSWGEGWDQLLKK